MSEPLIQDQNRPMEAVAALFDAMAARIRLNKDNSFGGAFVIIPPDNGGEPIVTLILDDKQDPAQFYTLLKVKAEAQIVQIDQLARQQGGYGRR